MKQCAHAGCTRPAEVKKIVGAPFSMTSTSTLSKTTIEICIPCQEQDERMRMFGHRATLK